MDEFTFYYNIAIIGECDTGKTALFDSLRGAQFNKNYISTIGEEFSEI